MEYYSVIKEKKLPFAKTWVDLEGIMLSEISQTEKDKYCMISLLCRIWKIKQTGEYNKKETDSDIENKPVVTSGERKGVGAIKRYKLLCMK